MLVGSLNPETNSTHSCCGVAHMSEGPNRISIIKVRQVTRFNHKRKSNEVAYNENTTYSEIKSS